MKAYRRNCTRIVTLSLALTFFAVIAWVNSVIAYNDTYPYRSMCPLGENPPGGGLELVCWDSDAMRTPQPGGQIEGGYWSVNCGVNYYAWTDRWGFAQCNCTSYVASKINDEFSKWDVEETFNNSYLDSHWGDAGNWSNAARNAGIPVDETPLPGDAVWWDDNMIGGDYGHIGWVERVYFDEEGEWISVDVTDYNNNGGSHDFDDVENYSRESIGNFGSPTGFVHILIHQIGAIGYIDGLEMSMLLGEPFTNQTSEERDWLILNHVSEYALYGTEEQVSQVVAYYESIGLVGFGGDNPPLPNYEDDPLKLFKYIKVSREDKEDWGGSLTLAPKKDFDVKVKFYEYDGPEFKGSVKFYASKDPHLDEKEDLYLGKDGFTLEPEEEEKEYCRDQEIPLDWGDGNFYIFCRVKWADGEYYYPDEYAVVKIRSPELVVTQLRLEDQLTGETFFYYDNPAFEGGEEVRVIAKVKNYGPGDLPDSTLLRYYQAPGDSHESIASYPSVGKDGIDRGDLDAGESETKSLSSYIIPTEPGNYRVIALVDPGRDIVGDDPSNNWLDLFFTVTGPPKPKPDLQFKEEEEPLWVNRKMSVAGQELFLPGEVILGICPFRVINPDSIEREGWLKSYIAPEGSSDWELIQEDKLTKEILETENNLVFHFEFTTPPEDGSYAIKVVMDSEDDIAEENEGNNVATATFTIKGISSTPGIEPNLYSSDFVLRDVRVEEEKGELLYSNVLGTSGDAVVLLAYIYLDNWEKLTSGFTIKAYASQGRTLEDPVLLKTTEVSFESVREDFWKRGMYYYQFNINDYMGNVPQNKGVHTIWFKIDSEDEVRESNEADNIASRVIIVRDFEDPILPGDINGDYVIDISDAILLLKVLAGTSPPQTRIFLEADVNGDGQLGLAEALFVLKKVAH